MNKMNLRFFDHVNKNLILNIKIPMTMIIINVHTFKFFTFFPSLTITPEDSWPIIIGSRTTKSPILPFTK